MFFYKLLIPSLTSYIQIFIHLTSLKLTLKLSMTSPWLNFITSTLANRLISWKHQSGHINSYWLLLSFVLSLPALRKCLNAHVLWFLLLVHTHFQLSSHESVLLSTLVTLIFLNFLSFIPPACARVTPLPNALSFLLFTRCFPDTSSQLQYLLQFQIYMNSLIISEACFSELVCILPEDRRKMFLWAMNL